ncbi:putative reverse transcriptase domain-containing protein [Tanacetum coccineum]
MPPRRLKKKSIKRLVEKRVAKAIEEYKKSRANLDRAGSSGGNPGNARGTMNVHGCSHKTFMNGKPHTFNGTEGVVGLRRWIEKVEQTMMTTEYCPATEIQKIEQKLWTLTLKGDDIEAYNNRFHELALMCPELVPTKKKKIEKYVRGFLERIKGNITSSKPATLHDAINIAHELVEQAVQGDMKLQGPMLWPQLRIEVMLGIYQSATVETFTIVGDAFQSVRSAKELVIWRRIVELYFQVHAMISCRMRRVMGVVRKYSEFGGNTRDLAHLEKKRTRLQLYTNISRISTQKLETASQITRDAVTTHLKTASQDLQTASDCTTQPII